MFSGRLVVYGVVAFTFVAFGGPFVPTWQNRVHALLYYVMLVAHV